MYSLYVEKKHECQLSIAFISYYKLLYVFDGLDLKYFDIGTSFQNNDKDVSWLYGFTYTMSCGKVTKFLVSDKNFLRRNFQIINKTGYKIFRIPTKIIP